MRIGIGILLVAGSFAGCASVPPPIPKSGPEQVRLIDPEVGQEPDEGYRTIGRVRAVASLGTPIAELTRLLRGEGAAVGADAVILERVRTTTESEAGLIASGGQGIVAEGIAIYYPGPDHGL